SGSDGSAHHHVSGAPSHEWWTDPSVARKNTSSRPSLFRAAAGRPDSSPPIPDQPVQVLFGAFCAMRYSAPAPSPRTKTSMRPSASFAANGEWTPPARLVQLLHA